MPAYTDFDYTAFPAANLFEDRHWLQLPRDRYREILKAQAEARQAALAADLPPDHQIILVPADPTYSPTEAELWPIVNQTVLSVLEHHPAVKKQVADAVGVACDQHRGWRNAHPVIVKPELPKK